MVLLFLWTRLAAKQASYKSHVRDRTCVKSALPAALAQSAGEGNPEEEDLFLTRAALQFLTIGKANNLDQKLEETTELLQSYESMARHGLPDTPLIRFLQFLVKVRFNRSAAGRPDHVLTMHFMPLTVHHLCC